MHIELLLLGGRGVLTAALERGKVLCTHIMLTLAVRGVHRGDARVVLKGVVVYFPEVGLL